MPSRVTKGVSFTKKAECRHSEAMLNIDIFEAGTEVLIYWHHEIQLKHIAPDDSRVDKNWNWPRHVRRQSFLANRLDQDPNCYVIGVNLGVEFLPLALVLLAENYPALYDKQKKSSFLWYMATAPESYYLEHISKQQILKLGKNCIDIGITTSFNNGNGGIIGLHAANEGGDGLLKFYQHHCKLLRLSNEKYVSLLRPNDGRYFYTNPNVALEFSQDQDHLR